MTMLLAGHKDRADMPLWAEFLQMARRQLACSDFDAEHPLYLELIRRHKITDRSALWLSFLYMAFYDDASAWVVFNSSDPFTVPQDINHLPIGTNRRNLFGGRIRRHLESLRDEAESTADWPIHNFTGDPQRDWRRLKESLGEVWGNGRFGQYTTAEMLHKVNGYPVEITDFDNKNSSGPADGVQRVSGCGPILTELDKQAEMIYQRLRSTKLHPPYTTTDRGVTESILCNFSGLCRGVYYSGRNIDRQQQRIARVETITGSVLHELWEARAVVFRPEDLGEHNGWPGIDKERLTHYQRTGEILWTAERRHKPNGS